MYLIVAAVAYIIKQMRMAYNKEVSGKLCNKQVDIFYRIVGLHLSRYRTHL